MVEVKKTARAVHRMALPKPTLQKRQFLEVALRLKVRLWIRLYGRDCLEI
jgi:hypothetical protein